MAKVRIISAPPGEAPKEVREVWIGLELPILGEGPVEMPHYRGVVTGDPVEGYSAYHVMAMEAFKLLRQKSEEAYHWWLLNTGISVFGVLSFHEDSCELVE